MFASIYNKACAARMALENPLTLVKKLERGDADSSGSTMRTAGVVALVLAIFLAIGAAVFALSNSTAGKITTPAFK